MNRDIIDYPASLLRFTSFDLEINVRGRSAGEGVSGTGQVIYGVQPRWEGSLEVILKDRDAILVWRALLSKMRGRLNIMRINFCDPLKPTLAEIGLPASDIALASTGIPHSTGAYFSTGAGYAVDPNAAVSFNVGAGLTSITVDASSIGDALRPGHYFTVNEWLYRITGISGESSARIYEFEPPLSQAVSAGDSIKINTVTQMVFEGDMGQSAVVKMIPVSRPKFRLIEHVNR